MDNRSRLAFLRGVDRYTLATGRRARTSGASRIFDDYSLSRGTLRPRYTRFLLWRVTVVSLGKGSDAGLSVPGAPPPRVIQAFNRPPGGAAAAGLQPGQRVRYQ